MSLNFSGGDTKTISIILIALFLATTVGAADLNANGYDWLKYTDDEKVALVEVIIKQLSIDTNEYSVEMLLLNLDAMYNMDTEEVLNTSCVIIIQAMIRQKSELRKYIK